MKIANVLFALGFLATANGQTWGPLTSGTARLHNAGFRYETRLEPATPRLAGDFGWGVMSRNAVFHRYMTENNGKKFFGYDLLMEPLPDAHTCRVTVRPLSIGAAGLRVKDPDAWSKMPLPGYPAPQVLRAGDTIALDLMVNRTTGQKIVEYIHIQDLKRVVFTASGKPRDFTVEDAELRLAEPRVSVNGKLVEPAAGHTGGVSGAAVWFYLPGHGRYFLSLAPHRRRGFQKAGEVRGSTLSFTVGGQRVSVDCNGRVVPGDAVYTLYVLHQALWRPKDAASRDVFGMAAGGRLDPLLQD